MIRRVADANATVLIRGETGTGKELVARALHEVSGRRNEPFVAVNCSALPGTLIESLIFGHERGAFTGAERRTRGQLELAGGGTMLLDEIAEMPIELQAKLLRVLEDRRFRPLGAEEERPLQARILASTHVDLQRRIAEGRFREDLYYRLNVVTLHVPPLAERGEDIPELVASFSADLPRKLRFTESAMTWLERRPWPGNVRELRNVVERVSLLSETDTIDVPTLEELANPPGAGNARLEIDKDGAVAPRLARAARLQARCHRARRPAPRHRSMRGQQERRGASHRGRPKGSRAPLGTPQRRAPRGHSGQRPARQRRRQQGRPVMRSLTIEIDGMSCDGCVASVTKVLSRVPGVRVDGVAVGARA